MAHRRFCRIAFAAFVVAAFAAIAPPAGAEDWPCFRGPSHQGVSQETSVPLAWSADKNIAWKTPIPGEGWSSPIVWGDRVFVTAATEGGVSLRLIAIDRATGKILWDREALKQQLGRKQPNNSYASSTPATDGERVYVFAFDGGIAAVAFDGSIAWTNRDFTFYSEHGPAVSVLLYKDLVIVPFDGSSSGDDPKLGWQKPWDQAFIAALDTKTGKLRWKASRGSSRIAHVTPNILTLDGKDQLVSGAGDAVQGFDLGTGGRLWTFTSPGEGVVPSIVLGEGLIFSASGFGDPAIRAVKVGGTGDVTKTHRAWELDKNVPMIPSFLHVEPHLFTVTESGMAMCLRAATGEVLGRQRLKGNYSASPVLAAGKILFLSDQGETTVIEPGPAFKVVAQNALGERCRASIAVSRGNLFIRGVKHLYCIGEGGRAVEGGAAGDATRPDSI